MKKKKQTNNMFMYTLKMLGCLTQLWVKYGQTQTLETIFRVYKSL